MFRKLAAILAILFALPAYARDDVAVLLKQADGFRLPAAAARVEADVETYRDDALDKQRHYTVYIKSERRSLLLMKSPMEIGQKILMLGDQFWLLMPDSQRPMRITANQKLLGEASTGDISSMIWSEDYEGDVAEETPCPPPPSWLKGLSIAARPHHCLSLSLNAARPGVTYAHVDLLLEKASRLPVKADLFVMSGKRAKEAWYVPKTVGGDIRIMGMLLLDDIQTNRYTLVHYRSIVPKDMPDSFFNPAALVHNSLVGW